MTPDFVTVLDDRRRARAAVSPTHVTPTAELTVIVLALSDSLDEARLREFAEQHLLPPLRRVTEHTTEDPGAKPAAPQYQGLLHIDDLRMDLHRLQVTLADRRIDLTHQEFLLLKTFLQHPGLVLSRRQLLDRSWEYPDPNSERTVDVHVRRLRAKLGAGSPQIVTVRRFGYRLDPREDD